MKEPHVQDSLFQPRGIEVGRNLRHSLLASLVPMGNGVSGADKFLLWKMWLVHHLGGAVFPFLIRHENRLTKIYQRLHKLRG